MPSYDVFLSCKSEDYAYAEEVYNFLTQNGVRVFLASRELRRLGDAEYRRQIVKALDQSSHIIVFASNKAYKLAAEQGYAKAKNNLETCYYNGEGITQSYEEAVKYYKLAANQGYDWAQCNLGDCYYDGKGVTKSVSEAIKWYKLAAEQGNEDAKAKLAKINNSTK